LGDTLGGECTIAHNDGSDTTAEEGNAAEPCGLYKTHTQAAHDFLRLFLRVHVQWLGIFHGRIFKSGVREFCEMEFGVFPCRKYQDYGWVRCDIAECGFCPEDVESRYFRNLVPFYETP